VLNLGYNVSAIFLSTIKPFSSCPLYSERSSSGPGSDCRHPIVAVTNAKNMPTRSSTLVQHPSDWIIRSSTRISPHPACSLWTARPDRVSGFQPKQNTPASEHSKGRQSCYCPFSDTKIPASAALSQVNGTVTMAKNVLLKDAGCLGLIQWKDGQSAIAQLTVFLGNDDKNLLFRSLSKKEPANNTPPEYLTQNRGLCT